MNETVSKHTPGPWTLKDHGAIFGPNDEYITDLGISGRYKNAEANARLIVAAPDLYEAALQMVEHFEEWDVDEDAFDGCVALLAAIAKAEGRS